MPRPKKDHGPCYYPGCTEKAKNRKLCKQHYVSATRMILNGQADEADLMRRGLLGPRAGAGGRALGETQYEPFLVGSKTKGKGPSTKLETAKG